MGTTVPNQRTGREPATGAFGPSSTAPAVALLIAILIAITIAVACYLALPQRAGAAPAPTTYASMFGRY